MSIAYQFPLECEQADLSGVLPAPFNSVDDFVAAFPFYYFPEDPEGWTF